MQGSAPYTERDRELVSALMTRAGLVVEAARASFLDRTVSETMQRALLPTLLPQPDHLQLASRYQPAENTQLVGGDWYDAYLDATGTTSLVVGDVAGHDIAAAVTMGQLRTELRMAGLDGTAGPARVLTPSTSPATPSASTCSPPPWSPGWNASPRTGSRGTAP